MRFMWNAAFYAILMVATLLGIFMIDGYFKIDLPNEAWTLIGIVVGALGNGFASAIDANIKLMNRDRDTVPTLTDTAE